MVPCDSYYSEGLYTLGIDIVKEAEKHGYRVAYQRIPGMYNVKLFSGDDNSDKKIDEFDYSKTVNSIKTWISKNAEWFTIRLDGRDSNRFILVGMYNSQVQMVSVSGLS